MTDSPQSTQSTQRLDRRIWFKPPYSSTWHVAAGSMSACGDWRVPADARLVQRRIEQLANCPLCVDWLMKEKSR